MPEFEVDREFIAREWDASAIPELVEYARIPNKSPNFDADWQAHGYMDEAVERLSRWARRQDIPGLELEVLRLEGRTPLLLIEVGGSAPGTVLLYGHLDKQPEMTGWREGLGPWQPVIEGDRFYARGVADDGYAIFASLISLRAVMQAGHGHPRCIVLIEACEESGSQDLPFYMDALSERIGVPDLVVCLDASCGSYDQLWMTSSLRGFLNGALRVDILTEGVHSGDASGIVPSSFRIARQILGRIEDAADGRIRPDFLHAEIPPQVRTEAATVAAALGERVYARFPFVPGATATCSDRIELLLNGTWRPTLCITGADGLPALRDAGNVLRPCTSLQLSLRLPPPVDAQEAARRLVQLLTASPPYGARVEFIVTGCADGWLAPDPSPALRAVIDGASQRHFGRPAAYMGDGGTIPFMDMLGKRYPQAEFVVTGLLGPGSNAHGPNEFMHIPTVKKLTCCVAEVIAAQSTMSRGVPA
jgi:acetylornithine deacetylase/succinyl-diaminopimelate desuccinylase-like protein